MLVYKCDGESYWTGKKCASEVEGELPTRWLSITGNIKNGFYDAHYLECNGMKHFCSPRCLENFLLKGVNPTSGQAGNNYMQLDPNNAAGQQEVTEQATEQVAAQESASQDQAMGVDSEEGGTEG